MFFLNDKIDKIIKQIEKLSKTVVDGDEAYKIELKTRKLHLEISEILFSEAQKHNYDTVAKIIRNNFVRADMVFNEKHLNIVQYSLFESDNELFKFLYYKNYKYINSYFNDIPSFFILLMNKRNFELLELFLSEEKLFSQLRKENICICFYLAIQENKDNLLELILSNKLLIEEIDGKDIQSIIIYAISHNQHEKLFKLFSFENLISKLEKEYIQNILALILLNKDIKSLDIVIDNDAFIKFIVSKKEILNNMAIFAYSNEDIKVLNAILKQKKKVEESLIDSTPENKTVKIKDDKFKKNAMIEDSL